MGMRDCPSTSFASASALTSGRELTFEEARDFARKNARARLALITICIAAPAAVVLIAWGGTRERVVERTRYALDGSREVFAEYKGAKKHGRYVEFHKNGRERIVGAFVEDVPTGTFLQYDWNGALRSRTSYVKGRLDGDWTVWDQRGGLESVTPYVLGTIHGKQHTFWDSGRVRAERPYSHGVIDGVERTYHENGLLASETRYDGGVPHGVARAWSDAGVLVLEGEHRDGVRDGAWRVIDELGEEHVEEWSAGELVGTRVAARALVDSKRRVR